MQKLTLSLVDLSIAFIPVVVVLYLMWRSEFNIKKPMFALARMLLQLLVIGYFLLYIFNQGNAAVIVALLFFMMLVASWIALNVVAQRTWPLYLITLIALLFGGGSVLLVITQGVMKISPWYQAKMMIPLAGMIFSSSMTGISIALERFESEYLALVEATSLSKKTITQKAFHAAMIPIINTMFAVGVVALPGMMTGQILSGVEPYIAARYQIMVMCMIFSATGLTVYVFLMLYTRCLINKQVKQ